MNTGDDGLIRLTLREMRGITLVHLISGLDEIEPGPARCGSRTTITGYTEWLGGDALRVTLGWDWAFDPAGAVPLWRRIGSPRTNVQLTDSAGRDFVWHKSLALLGTLIDAVPWADEARCAIALRYAA